MTLAQMYDVLENSRSSLRPVSYGEKVPEGRMWGSAEGGE
jgi:hypothetical protein